MSKKVSVIVPVYNVEKFLNRCVKSIVGQSYQNLEIILVNDGSTDGSPAICDQWESCDHRIKTIHKKNGGLSSARNAGLEKATGDYIMFEDSDDWLDKELIRKCVNRMQEDNSDMVIFGYRKVNEEEKKLGEFTFGNQSYSREEMTSQLFQRILEMSFGYAWNKMYHLETIKKSGLKFDGEIIDREDLVFNIQLLNYLNKISYLEFVGYSYLQRGTSLLHNASLSRMKSVNIFCKKIDDIYIDNLAVKKKVYNMNVLHYLSDCIIKNIFWNDDLNKKEKLRWMEEVIRECPSTDKLYQDCDNPKHLQVLYKAMKTGKAIWFYRYVRMSDLKRKIYQRMKI